MGEGASGGVVGGMRRAVLNGERAEACVEGAVCAVRMGVGKYNRDMAGHDVVDHDVAAAVVQHGFGMSSGEDTACVEEDKESSNLQLTISKTICSLRTWGAGDWVITVDVERARLVGGWESSRVTGEGCEIGGVW